MKYSIKNGMFLSKESEESTNEICGVLAGIRAITPNNTEIEYLQIDLKDVDEYESDLELEIVSTLTIPKYGDASYEILRRMFGIAEVIAGKYLAISIQGSVDDNPSINVSADGEDLVPCGDAEPYAAEKKLLTDMIISVLKRCFEFRSTILVYSNVDNVYPMSEDGSLDVYAIADYIRDLRRAGRHNELTVKKTTFTSLAAAKGYEKALRDLAMTNSYRYTKNKQSIDLLWDAYNCELEAPEDED